MLHDGMIVEMLDSDDGVENAVRVINGKAFVALQRVLVCKIRVGRKY